MKKLISILLSVVIFTSLFVITACADELSLSAQAYVLYCVENGEFLLSYNGDRIMKPASTTKIMTTLLALEYIKSHDPYVEFTEDMIAEGSSMYLSLGDTVHLSDLAVGMMMASGNDAANATAITISGSMDDFSVLMNKKAKEIGMTNTNFVTPSGLDDENHYSTAQDLALLMAEALKNERFLSITGSKSMEVNFLTPQKTLRYDNHNRLLSQYEYCIGGKTGYTKSAGRCLVTAAKKDGLTLICVTLNAPSDWSDHTKLYDYGFQNFSVADTSDATEKFTINVVGSDKNKISLYTNVNKNAVVNTLDVDRVERTVFVRDFLYAPVQEGDYIGVVTYKLDGEIIAQNPIFAQEDAGYIKVHWLKRFWRFLKRVFTFRRNI